MYLCVSAHAKEALNLAKMQEETTQLEHQTKYKVGSFIDANKLWGSTIHAESDFYPKHRSRMYLNIFFTNQTNLSMPRVNFRKVKIIFL